MQYEMKRHQDTFYKPLANLNQRQQSIIDSAFSFIMTMNTDLIQWEDMKMNILVFSE